MDAVSGIQQFLEYVVLGIADHPHAVRITRRENHGTTIFDLSADPEDIPRLIGSAGSTVSALRSLVQASADRHGLHVGVEIAE